MADRWLRKCPRTAGKWLMRCSENDLAEEVVELSWCGRELLAKSGDLGILPVECMHDGLTDVSWRKIPRG